MSVFFDHIRSGFPALWLQTQEPTRAMGEYTTESQKMGFKSFSWDFNQGIKEIGNGFTSATEAGDAVGAIKFLRGQPAKSILFLLNFHKFIGEIDVFQEIANQADGYTGSGKCVV